MEIPSAASRGHPLPISLGQAAAAWAVTHRVRADRWNIRYREAGRGPAVVLVHGLGMAADYWHRNAPVLAAAGYRVLAPDLPGFGRTEGPADGLTISEQAAAVARWSREMGLGPAVFVGHSLSCQSVLELAATHPDAVRGLILAAPTGDGGTLQMLRQAWRLFLDAWREPRMLLVLAGTAYLQAGPVRFWHTWRSGRLHDPLRLLPRVRAPGLVVVGTRDPVVRRHFVEQLAAGLLSGRIEWIPGGTHAVLLNQPEGFNRVTLEFLKEVYGAR